MSKEEEYQQVFLAEAKGLDADLQAHVAALKSNASDKKAVSEIFRLVHTIKGNANVRYATEARGEEAMEAT